MSTEQQLSAFEDCGELAEKLRAIAKALPPEQAYFLVESAETMRGLYRLCNELAREPAADNGRVSRLDALPRMAMLNDRELAEQIGVATTTIWRWARDGAFPKPIRVGKRCTRWRVGEVRDYLAAAEKVGAGGTAHNAQVTGASPALMAKRPVD